MQRNFDDAFVLQRHLLVCSEIANGFLCIKTRISGSLQVYSTADRWLTARKRATTRHRGYRIRSVRPWGHQALTREYVLTCAIMQCSMANGPAFQVCSAPSNCQQICHRLGDTVANQQVLVDPFNPSHGLTVNYSNGDICSLQLSNGYTMQRARYVLPKQCACRRPVNNSDTLVFAAPSRLTFAALMLGACCQAWIW
jgi:hypothetical protein